MEPGQPLFENDVPCWLKPHVPRKLQRRIAPVLGMWAPARETIG
jgi:hypothetical protein